MLPAQSNNMGVVHEVSRDSRLLHHLIQERRVHGGFGEQHQRRRSQYCLQILQGNLRRQGRMIDTGMRDEAQELVNTWPWNRPRCWTLGKLRQDLVRA